jgi:hypothetical protein
MTGALTPEELETLLEDAFLLRDSDAIAALFEPHALLAVGRRGAVRGSGDVMACIEALWRDRATYLASPERIAQANDLALILAPGATNVARRGTDRTWRYVITAMHTPPDGRRRR